MKSLMRIFARYVAAAVGVGLALLALNLAVGLGWLVGSSRNTVLGANMQEIADSLTATGEGYTLSPEGLTMLRERYQWGMLLDESGEVIWSENLPEQLARHYSIVDVARFTHWYLEDYPVRVWQHPGGLMVLGSPVGSYWKHGVEVPEQLIDHLFEAMGLGGVLNIVAAILLALLFGWRLFRSLRPLLDGIARLAEHQDVRIATDGLLGDLAEKLNQTSRQLRTQATALQKRDTARTTWIAGISHDIRTPLSMVMGYAAQLEESPALPEAERKQAGVIVRQSEKIKALVNDLNLASKLEYAMQPLRVGAFSPAALARGVATDLLNGGLSEAYSLEVTVAEAAQGLTLRGDEALLRRALHNLLLNSVEHNPEGCAIRLAVEQGAEGCRMTVMDDGVGFATATLTGLAATPGLQPEFNRRGLGLVLVRQIAESHGGRVEFQNRPTGGCQATMWLPVDGEIQTVSESAG